MATKGIILAGGEGTRLFPLTKVYSKQLVAVFDKPMVYYPLNTLISANIKDILIITDSKMAPLYKQLFSNGNTIGLNINYAIQQAPNGIAESFIIAEDFIGTDNVCLILGDNIFYGDDYVLWQAVNQATDIVNNIFTIQVYEPQKYGVVKFNSHKKPIEIIEKPTSFVSNYAVPGLYIYDCSVVKIAKSLKPSNRNELEITDINNILLQQNNINISVLSNNITWFDCGTPQALLNAANFIASIEQRSGKKIGCYEETAYQMNFISQNQLITYCKSLPKGEYCEYLCNIAKSIVK